MSDGENCKKVKKIGKKIIQNTFSFHGYVTKILKGMMFIPIKEILSYVQADEGGRRESRMITGLPQDNPINQVFAGCDGR